jgi:hypothetical protein
MRRCHWVPALHTDRLIGNLTVLLVIIDAAVTWCWRPTATVVRLLRAGGAWVN